MKCDSCGRDISGSPYETLYKSLTLKLEQRGYGQIERDLRLCEKCYEETIEEIRGFRLWLVDIGQDKKGK